MRYGAKTLELAKGKNAVELGNESEIADALRVIKSAAHAGELDAQLDAVGRVVKVGLSK